METYSKDLTLLKKLFNQNIKNWQKIRSQLYHFYIVDFLPSVM